MPREDGRRRRARAEANPGVLTSSERADVPWAVPRPRPARPRLTEPAPDRTRPPGPRSGGDPGPEDPSPHAGERAYPRAAWPQWRPACVHARPDQDRRR